MKFKGDIIITDPCYVLRSGESHNDDWNKCDYGENMEALGFSTYFTRDTLYGDWSCTTFKAASKEDLDILLKYNDPSKLSTKLENIGSFCADAGLVSVFLLSEILKYNPDYKDHLSKSHAATLIKDFDGDVDIHIVDGEELHVFGKGNICFITSQTGF